MQLVMRKECQKFATVQGFVPMSDFRFSLFFVENKSEYGSPFWLKLKKVD